MEWLKKRSLRQSFFIISALFLCIGLLFSIASFLFCVKLQSAVDPSVRYELSVGENGEIVSAESSAAGQETSRVSRIKSTLLTVLQFALPVFFVVSSLLLADVAFWRLKLKKPLAVLQNGAARIRQQDLDFEIVPCSADELGLLCRAFEQMRRELLHNNQELWRQIEERKRLNAAFSHDLRNPVTVLKGSAALLQKSFQSGTVDAANAQANLALIAAYTNRIETYIEAMTMAQKLGDWKCAPRPLAWPQLAQQLRRSLSFLGEGTGKKLSFSVCGAAEEIYADQAILQNVAENLVNNALRYAGTLVQVALSHSDTAVTLCVTDDGDGFSPAVLAKGIRPFLRGGDEGEHFGMGLYVCRLLCQKHGGTLEIENRPESENKTESENAGRGAKVTATFGILNS